MWTFSSRGSAGDAEAGLEAAIRQLEKNQALQNAARALGDADLTAFGVERPDVPEYRDQVGRYFSP